MDLASLKSNSLGKQNSTKIGSFIAQDGNSSRSSKLSKKLLHQQTEHSCSFNEKGNSKLGDASLIDLSHSIGKSQEHKLSTGEMKETRSIPWYGWDGYEARFADSTLSTQSNYLTPKCIPPWAKTLRAKHGLPISDIVQECPVERSSAQMQDKIEKLMKKHNQLMLVKRTESKSQVILEKNKHNYDMDGIKLRTKNTRYYVAPLTKTNHNRSIEDSYKRVSKISDDKLAIKNSVSDNQSTTYKTSMTPIKKEIFNVLKTLKTRATEKKYEIYAKDNDINKADIKCQKITMNNIRDYINNQTMNPDEKKLQEIIKIEKVPSGDIEDRRKTGTKYIINVPQNKGSGMASVDVIKIKEKHKITLHNMENIDEHITELQYNQPSMTDVKDNEEHSLCSTEIIQKKLKSATETKILEVTSKRTPKIDPLIDKDTGIGKLLLIQYEKKSKFDKKKDKAPSETKTQLLGVEKSYSKDPIKEIYLYGTETDGTTVRENVETIKDISPTLKDRVNLIFEELKELALKTPSEPPISSKDDTTIEATNEVLTTDVATVQAVPEVKSAEVQVQPSVLLTAKVSENQMSDADKRQLGVEKSEVRQEYDENIEDEQNIQSKFSENGTFDKELSEKEYAGTFDKELSEKEHAETFDKELYEKEHDDTKVGSEIVQLDVSTADDIQPSMLSTTKTEGSLSKSEMMSSKSTVESPELPVIPLEGEELLKAELTQSKSEIKTEESTENIDGMSSKLEMAASDTDVESQKEKFITEEIDIGDVEESGLSEMETADISKKISHDNTIGMSFNRVMNEDIRSYELSPEQDDLTLSFSTKFLHGRKTLRKKMNWNENDIYLEEKTCPQLVRALAEIAMHRPVDPISFLAHWIYKDCHNKEMNEQREVWHEHLELARAMEDMEKEKINGKKLKKFNLRKYPIIIEEPMTQDQEEQSNINYEMDLEQNELEEET